MPASSRSKLKKRHYTPNAKGALDGLVYSIYRAFLPATS
jgi:hypothetical protein